MRAFLFSSFFALFLAATFAGEAAAQEFTSTNFKVVAPVLDAGGHSSSASFILQSIIAGFSSGTSSSAAFGMNAGFLHFPFVSTPVVSATAGQNAQVPLSWTSASGVLGWTVGGYTVGQATASGGPYSYADVGNVTSSTRTGLTNGTAYYFVVISEDAFGNHIATSSEVSATPAAAATPSVSGGGGGGGGISAQSAVNFFGRAYPGSRVTLLRDAQMAVQTVAGPDSKFEIRLGSLSAGSYVFSVHGEDANGLRSAPVTFPVAVTDAASTNISGIFLAPTVNVDKTEVRRGDNVAIFGQSAPQSSILVEVNSEETQYASVQADDEGVYLYNLDTSPLEYGRHSAKTKARLANEISAFGKAIGFTVGSKNVARALERATEKGDGNGDGRVNLVDFSMAAYWYGRTAPPASADLNGDGRVNLVDFSILAFHWTG